MASHTVLIGCSDTGCLAADVLSAALAPPELLGPSVRQPAQFDQVPRLPRREEPAGG